MTYPTSGKSSELICNVDESGDETFPKKKNKGYINICQLKDIFLIYQSDNRSCYNLKASSYTKVWRKEN